MSQTPPEIPSRVEEILGAALDRKRATAAEEQKQAGDVSAPAEEQKQADDAPAPAEEQKQFSDERAPTDGNLAKLGEVQSLLSAVARAIFGFFLLIVSVLVFEFGTSVQMTQPIDGVVIKILSAMPFLGGSWYLHCATKALRDRADALQKLANSALKQEVDGPN